MRTEAKLYYSVKSERIGNVVVELNKADNGNYIIETIVHGPKTSEVVKTWEFKNPATQETLSLYFFNYVVREVKQHAYTNTNSIPDVLMNMTTKDAETAIESVLLHLSK